MYFTAHFKQIILAFALLIVLVGQVSALPVAHPDSTRIPKDTDRGHGSK